MTRVLFVCLGNICRSPAAEGVLKHAMKKDENLSLEIQSCGLGSWHIGELPDIRMQDAAKTRGIVLTSLGQQIKPEFFTYFDYILAADREVLKELYQHAATSEQKNKIHLMTAFSSGYKGQDVPDAYYENDAAFELVLDMLEDSCEGLVDHIKSHK